MNIKAILTGIVALGIIAVTGCSSEANNDNLVAGMELVEESDYQEALDSFDQAFLSDEDLELVYRGQGLAYMGLGEYELAQESFINAIMNADNKLTDLEYDINYYLAVTYMKQEKYSEAEEIYSAIIALRKKETQAYYLRGCSVLRQERYDDAIEDFESAFSLDSSNLDLVINAYLEMQDAGFADEGMSYIQEFLEKNDKKLSNGEKGEIYFYLEDYENARICLDAYINGNDSNLALILGKTYEKLGDLNYAAVVYQTFLENNTPTAALYNSLGICLMSQTKYSEAQAAFQKGIDLGNSDYIQELRFNLIVANEYLGEFDTAKSLMGEYVQIYPDDYVAKRENEFLLSR